MDGSGRDGDECLLLAVNLRSHTWKLFLMSSCDLWVDNFGMIEDKSGRGDEY